VAKAALASPQPPRAGSPRLV